MVRISDSKLRRNDSIGVLMAAYNEEKNIESVLQRIPKSISQVVVVDDGSTDKTAELAQQLSVLTVSHPINMGKGAAIRTGLKYITTDIIVFLDADGQHRPEEIPALVDPLLNGTADLVIGSRLLKGVATMPPIRALSNLLAASIIHLRIGHRVYDTQSGFRAIFRRHIQTMELQSTRFEFESEILLCALHNGLRILEIPISMIYGNHESYFRVDDMFNFLKAVIAF